MAADPNAVFAALSAADQATTIDAVGAANIPPLLKPHDPTEVRHWLDVTAIKLEARKARLAEPAAFMAHAVMTLVILPLLHEHCPIAPLAKQAISGGVNGSINTWPKFLQAATDFMSPPGVRTAAIQQVCQFACKQLSREAILAANGRFTRLCFEARIPLEDFATKCMYANLFPEQLALHLFERLTDPTTPTFEQLAAEAPAAAARMATQNAAAMRHQQTSSTRPTTSRPSSLATNPPPAATASTDKAARREYRRANKLCFYCGESGHSVDHCPAKATASTSGNGAARATPH